ncbi:ATP-binding cassette domain-containing protein [Kitasatospora acidiphila]|uniref:ATP-binding cassette domain-containing protein n=1 Tax=Kitasatospora acidiphila TaxID=2567942 RepID=A0A540VZU9_9ACTN|nr:ATP-binding cassette domain-containing protein [Kitasatospora acidiphila]TQF01624.1 ATP-binding cassette domain-containing protein [Kitasatospora acidiphila]
MSTSTALLTELGDERARGQDDEVSARLQAWAEPGRGELRRAGLLRGLAPLGTVLWAAGLAWAAQRGLTSQNGARIPVRVLPGAGLVLAGLAVRSVLLCTADAAAARGARRVRAALRERLLAATLPAHGPTRTGLGDAALAESLTGEVARLSEWLTEYVPARTTMLLGSGLTLAAIATRGWFVALILVAATPLLPANLKVIGLGTQAAVHAQLTAVRHHSARLLDQLRGLPTLIGLGAREAAALSLREDDEELAHRTQTVLRVAFLSTAWIELLITGSLAVVATYCGLALLNYLQLPLVPGHMSLATALFVLVLTPAYFAPARDLARGYHARAEARAAAELIEKTLGSAGTAGEDPDQPAPARRSGGTVGVQLEGVTVRHPGRVDPALEGVRLQLAPGAFLAVTGPSGAGKSTLLAVAAGLAEPTAGTVTHEWDGTSQPPSPAAVAWVGQPAHLLPGTVRDNLLLARPDATDAELAAAFGTLGFGDLLSDLPGGLDTAVGERGSGLSSGQSQQLALVRALLRDAPLLCLDEPTAHLDPVAEARVVAAVRTLTHGRSVLLATHSPALLPLADRTIRLDRGRPH